MKTLKEIKEDVDLKLWELKYKATKKAEKAIKWCEENKELAIAMIPVGLVAIRSIGNTIRSVDRKIDLKKEQELQDLYTTAPLFSFKMEVNHEVLLRKT